MSLNQSNISNSTNSNVSVIELYWNLVAKADKKFSKIRDLPYYQRTRYDTYFYKVFKVYTQLWKFQQENRQKLVEAGLKRWEIGEIASRIGQLYFGQYMRTSEASYLSESYIFYEAILTREYFKEGLYQDINLASKQLRFLARFLTVCLVFNRREVVYQLVNQLKMLLDECKRTFQESDFKEWKLVIQEIVKFLKADTAFMNIRPLRYSVVLDLQPNSLPHVDTQRKLKLRDALLCSYHPNEVKFSELTLDTFRMLQCLEWEPSGLFYQTNMDASSENVANASQNGTPGSNRVNQDITDPTLAPNPRKAVLYRPSVTHFMAVLGTVCEELAPDGILLIYLSASGKVNYTFHFLKLSLSLTLFVGHDKHTIDCAPGRSAHTLSSPSRAAHSIGYSDNIVRGFQFHSINSESTSAHPTSFGCNSADLHSDQSADCLHIGARGNGGMNCIYPCDLLPFTRRPLFLIIDSDSSKAFKAISGTEKGERVAMLLSPATSLPIHAIDSTHQPSGSSFTSFLTAPLQSFILLLGFSGSDVEMDMYNKAEQLLYSSLNQWGLSLTSSDNLDPVWAQILCDPFLRRLLLRFVFCRAVLSLYVPSSGRIEFLPECVPRLPDVVSPTSANCQASVLQLADIIGARDKFTFSQETILPED